MYNNSFSKSVLYTDSSSYMLLWKSWKCVRLVVDEAAGQRAETQKDLLRVGKEKQSASGWTPRSVDNEDVWPQQPACFLTEWFLSTVGLCLCMSEDVYRMCIGILFWYTPWEHLYLHSCSIMCILFFQSYYSQQIHKFNLDSHRQVRFLIKTKKREKVPYTVVDLWLALTETLCCLKRFTSYGDLIFYSPPRIATNSFVIFLNHTYCYNQVFFFQFHQTDLTQHNLPFCQFSETVVIYRIASCEFQVCSRHCIFTDVWQTGY